jgi:hypothetical protein
MRLKDGGLPASPGSENLTSGSLMRAQQQRRAVDPSESPARASPTRRARSWAQQISTGRISFRWMGSR